MVNVKAEYPEGYKVIYENPNIIHTIQQDKKELDRKELDRKEWDKEIWEKEEKLIENCPNEEIEIVAFTSGVIAKIPVILAAFTVQVNINSLIEFSEPIFQIKEIMKKVNIYQCTIMQDTDVLFIKGSIKKNIGYYTNTFSNNNEIYGEVQTLTLDIPFKCTTHIKYNILKPQEIIKSTVKEFKYIKNHEYINNGLDENENIAHEDSDYINQIVNEYYNEAPYCEVVSNKIIEAERLIQSKSDTDNSSMQHGIYAIEGEGVLYITIRILQNRLVSIPMVPWGMVLG